MSSDLSSSQTHPTRDERVKRLEQEVEYWMREAEHWKAKHLQSSEHSEPPQYVDSQLVGMRKLWAEQEKKAVEQLILPFFSDMDQVHNDGLSKTYLKIRNLEVPNKLDLIIAGSLFSDKDSFIAWYTTKDNETIPLSVRGVCEHYLNIYRY